MFVSVVTASNVIVNNWLVVLKFEKPEEGVRIRFFHLNRGVVFRIDSLANVVLVAVRSRAVPAAVVRDNVLDISCELIRLAEAPVGVGELFAGNEPVKDSSIRIVIGRPGL